MKKLNALMIGLLIAGSAMAQMTPPLKPVAGWGLIPATPAFATTPLAKSNADIYLRDFTFDEVEYVFDEIWDNAGEEFANDKVRVGTDFIAKPEGVSAAWKAFYTTTDLVILYTYTDANAAAAFKGGEIMWQSAYKDRFEPDFTAAGADVQLQNNSYARFNTLGSGKTELVLGKKAAPNAAQDSFFVKETVGSRGDGTWGARVGDMQIKTYWVKEGNTNKVITFFPFATALAKNTDPYDANSALETFVPTAGTQIAYEIKVSAEKLQMMWNSANNDGYGNLYYNGYLTFKGEPVKVADVIKSKLVSKISQNEIIFSKDVNASVYNLMGQQVRSIKNTDRISISGLAKGVYVVKSGNSSFKFVK